MTGVPPDAVIERAQQLFDLTIWREDVAIGDALLKNVAGMDALIVMPGDKLSAETIAALPDSIKVLGFVVGLHRSLQIGPPFSPKRNVGRLL